MLHRLIVAAAIGLSAPASAALTSFANFSGSANLAFVNSGDAVDRTTDAKFYTTASGTDTMPGTALVQFSFIDDPSSGAFTDVTAAFTLWGLVVKNSPAQVRGNSLTQTGLIGGFTFLTTTAISFVGPDLLLRNYAAGSILLQGVFSGGAISSDFGSSQGMASVATRSGDAIFFYSDILDAQAVLEGELAFDLTSIMPAFSVSAGDNGALNSFRAVFGGSISGDPPPYLPVSIPEPGVWGMLIVGFGLVGVQMRRRKPVRATRKAEVAYASDGPSSPPRGRRLNKLAGSLATK